ncbi:hypothetical protein BH18ACT5_BH18ACT5_14490 [soil metagenome]
MTLTHTKLPRTISWGEFANEEPELARFRAERLTAAPAYLATLRRNGVPRVHPVAPIISPLGLYLFMEPTSPKVKDLQERGWFSLHNGVPDNAGSGGEFSVTGRGLFTDDPDMWSHVGDASSYTPLDRYVVFELQLGEARCHGYGDVPIPSTAKWSVTQ